MTPLAELLQLIASLPGREPPAAQPAGLVELFADLRAEPPGRASAETEEMIWTMWSSHPDPAAERRLGLATRAIAREEYRRAERLLEPLVRDHPAWSEAWHKRATLRYLDGRDGASIDDFRRTLELEPRHFGALCGLAQVCLRRGERAVALVAFEAALAIHPRLAGVRAAADELRGSMAASVH